MRKFTSAVAAVSPGVLPLLFHLHFEFHPRNLPATLLFALFDSLSAQCNLFRNE